MRIVFDAPLLRFEAGAQNYQPQPGSYLSAGACNHQPQAAAAALAHALALQNEPLDQSLLRGLSLQDFGAWKRHQRATLGERFADFKQRLAEARVRHP